MSGIANGTKGRRLTRRELEVLTAMTRGLTAAQIAHRWHVSERTVNTHKYNTYRKLGASNAAEAITQAVRQGLIRFRTADGTCPLCGCHGVSHGRRVG